MEGDMPEIPAVESLSPKSTSRRLVTWSDVGNSDTYEPYEFGDIPTDITIHIVSIVGSETVTVKGSNDGSNYENLKTLTGDTAALSADGVISILERPAHIQIEADSGGGSQNNTVIMCLSN